MENNDTVEKSNNSCCTGRLYLTDLLEFYKGCNEHVDYLVAKAGVGFQQGFTISLTKGS